MTPDAHTAPSDSGYVSPDSSPTVAIALDDSGRYLDRCFTWGTGQTLAQEGLRVVATADDGHMTLAEAQRLYDWERDCYNDCFNNPNVRQSAPVS